MPEGDVVWYTARRLHEALAGRVLTRSDFRVPRLATADLSGDVVTETVSRGKHLLTRTKSGLTVHRSEDLVTVVPQNRSDDKKIVFVVFDNENCFPHPTSTRLSQAGRIYDNYRTVVKYRTRWQHERGLGSVRFL